MQLPDTSDAVKMAAIGRLTVLRRARNEAVKKLRDKVVTLCNAAEQYTHGASWDVSGMHDLIDMVQAINAEIERLEK